MGNVVSKGVVVCAVLVVMATTGEAEMLCRKKSGKLFVRPECKAKEQAVDLVALGAGSSKGLSVVDSTGTVVGDVIGVETGDDDRGPLLVGIRSGGFVGSVWAHPRGLAGTSSLQPVYTDATCTGTPYLLTDSLAPVLYTPDADPDAGLSASVGYHPGLPVQQITVQATASTESGPTCGVGVPMTAPVAEATNVTWCCYAGESWQAIAGPLTSRDLSGFTAPFRVE